VEVLSPFNSKAEIEFKKQLYFRAGAEEYWVCDEEGALQFFNLSGPTEKPCLCPAFPSILES
jgi:Uma2 family endonuclease